MFGELESLEKKPPMPTVTLSDQMASALDMVGSGGGEEVAEQTAAEQLLEYRDRNKHDLDDFVPLTAKAGEPSTAGGKFLLGQLGGTAVAAPTYWKSAECQMGRKSFKKDRYHCHDHHHDHHHD